MTLPWEYNNEGKINFEERTFSVDNIIAPSLYYKKETVILNMRKCHGKKWLCWLSRMFGKC